MDNYSHFLYFVNVSTFSINCFLLFYSLLYQKHFLDYKHKCHWCNFDISFIRGLSLEDGVATLTDFTASIIGEELSSFLKNTKEKIREILVCGGGRKNKVLIRKIKENLFPNTNFKNLDDYNINGDFVESQAFAFLAVRSILKLPISFPKTTGCKIPCFGGNLIKKLN